MAAYAAALSRHCVALTSNASVGELLLEVGGTEGGSVVPLARAALSGLQAGDYAGCQEQADVCYEVAWERLHTGDWKDVATAWRELYSLSCLLLALARLLPLASAPPAAECAPGPGARSSLPAAGEAGVLAGALRLMDLAAMMGGVRMRRQVDSLAQLVQAWLQSATVTLRAAADQPTGRVAKAARMSEGGPHARSVESGTGFEGVLLGEEPQVAVPLPPGSLQRHGAAAEVVERPSLEWFLQHAMGHGGGDAARPVVVTGCMAHWPALARWRDPDYLLAAAGPRTVPVEVGRDYLDDSFGTRLITLEHFLRAHLLPPRATAGAVEPAAGGPTGSGGAVQMSAVGACAAGEQEQRAADAGGAGASDARAVPGMGGSAGSGGDSRVDAGRAYLAQHALFDQLPALARDIATPDYCCLGEGKLQSVNAWLGPAATVTPLHTDPHHNLLAQAVGRKYVRLYPPALTPSLYPFPTGMTTNSSQVDLDAPDLSRFPSFPGTEGCVEAVLGPGDMLYIPPGWWHYVKALTTSFSVSFWWC